MASGAMGDVDQVKNLKDNCVIALKFLSKERTSSEAVQRFKREFQLFAERRHPNLCTVYDFGMLKDGRSYFTMEYIDGKDIFDATQNLSYEKIYPFVTQLCRALEYIHAKAMGTKDLYVEALLLKVRNGLGHAMLAKHEIRQILQESSMIAEEISYPEILWKVYLEDGRFRQADEEYLTALEYYEKCVEIFKAVSRRIKSESGRKSLLHRPDRQEVYTAINEVEQLI